MSLHELPWVTQAVIGTAIGYPLASIYPEPTETGDTK